LKQIYVTTKEKKSEFKEKVAEQVPRGTNRSPPLPQLLLLRQRRGGAFRKGKINVVVDETNNALVIRSFARDYKGILETIRN